MSNQYHLQPNLMSNNYMNFIEDLIQTNNDYSHITQMLTNKFKKQDALLQVLDYKLQNDLSKTKLLLVDQVLNSLHRLINI